MDKLSWCHAQTSCTCRDPAGQVTGESQLRTEEHSQAREILFVNLQEEHRRLERLPKNQALEGSNIEGSKQYPAQLRSWPPTGAAKSGRSAGVHGGSPPGAGASAAVLEPPAGTFPALPAAAPTTELVANSNPEQARLNKPGLHAHCGT